MNKHYFSCAETAKLVRKAIKEAFPTIKFSVRSKTYSGGASIDVGWMDGPTADEVRKVTGSFVGGGFDGMIDMAYSVSHWLMPDGTTVVRHSSGTEGSRGVVPAISNEKPHPDAVMVHFGADHIFANRAYSVGMINRAVDYIHRKWGGFDRDAVVIKTWDFAERKGEAYFASHELRMGDNALNENVSVYVHRELSRRRVAA